MLLSDIVATSDAVSGTRSRSKKIELLADTLRRLDAEEARVAVSFLSGQPTQRRLGVGYATVFAAEVDPIDDPVLEILEVDRVLQEISETSGSGSKGRKEALLADLVGRATESEQEYLRGLILRNLRQGALQGVMAEAVAAAVDVAPDRVRRAAMLEGDLIGVAARALAQGPESLGAAAVTVFTPVQPMLARTAESAEAAIADLGEALVETKLDGLRVQVHRDGDRVSVFSRNLRDITDETPGIVRAALEVAAESFILDGEGLVVSDDGTPLSFQDVMSRPETGHGLALTAFYFDILHRDGSDLIDEPLARRRAELESLLAPPSRVSFVVTSDPAEAERFFAEAVAAGFEGVVVKDLTQGYEAGRRGTGWLKVKPTHTLDLVVLAAEWGSGRREGWLSNLHLGARDPDGGFVMLGKTFKGLTDRMLEWQTPAFLEIEERREGRIVFLKPRIVYEIAFDGVQRSTRYPGGVTLRFARVKRHRNDKDPSDADTLATVRSYLR
jgi:DNA ligase 1